MSRRTKLIILAVFLVLLAIPVGYVTLTWSRPDPLRFRVAGHHELVSAESKVDIIVENTSDLPMHLAILSVPNPASGYSPDATNRDGLLIPQHPDRPPIPAHGSVTVPMNARFQYVTPPHTLENVKVWYYAVSETQYKYGEVLWWLKTHLPQPLSSWIPEAPLGRRNLTTVMPRQP